MNERTVCTGCPFSFDPLERMKAVDEGAPYRNVGIRLVNGIARDVQYQNLLGTNVLTIRT